MDKPTLLPFGLRSAPIIFTAIADALQWVIESHGVQHIMYHLDDYLLLGPPKSLECQRALETTLTCSQNMGVPVVDLKIEGPSTVLAFLGIELDKINRTLRRSCKRRSGAGQGAATTAAEKGMEDSIIKTLGRWNSIAYLQYVKIPREQLASYSKLLCV